MKKLSLVNLSKENPLTKDDLKKLKGGYVQPGDCYCQCACTYASAASAHNSSDHSNSGVKKS